MLTNNYVDILKNCYRKFKSCVYYQNTLIYLRESVASFEKNEKDFNERINKLANALSKRDASYFDKQIKSISAVALPKKVNEIKNEQIRENMSERKTDVEISEVNFYFDAPVEMFLLDVFLTMEIGSATHWEDYWYANIMHREAVEEITREPKYNNLNLFSYYFTQYKRWKNDAIEKSRELYDAKEDSSIISLDISGYYYHINADIMGILKKCEIAIEDEVVLFAIKTMQKAFKKYTSILKTMRSDIPFSSCLPIGLNISCLLSNFYLKGFDEKINGETLKYGRYVDDIIFVIKGCEYNSFEDYANKTTLFSKKGDAFVLGTNPELSVKNDKCRIIKNYAAGSNDIFDKLKTEEFNVSEFRLFPNFTTNVDDLLNGIFEQQNYIKFRDFEDIRIDKTKISQTINGLILSTKGTRYKDDEKLYTFISNFHSRLKNTDLVLLWSKWDKLFFLFNRIDKKSKECFDSFYDQVRNLHSLVTFKNGDKQLYKTNETAIKRINNLVNAAMKKVFYNSVYSLYALTGLRRHISGTKRLEMIENFRRANLFDISAVNYPLINYLVGIPSKIDFSNVQIQYYLDNVINVFDSFRIKYSPVFIGLSDYLVAMELKGIFHKGNYNFKEIYKDYYELIGVNYGVPYIPLTINSDETVDYRFEKIDLANISRPVLNINESEIKIAVAGIDLDKVGIVYKDKETNVKKLSLVDLGYLTKTNVIRLLNESYYRDFNQNVANIIESNRKNKKPVEVQAEKEESNKKEPVNYIVFPEAFLPISWIHLYDKFAKETQSTIISGIRYVVYKNTAYNLVSVHVPYYDHNYHRQSLVRIRMKNVIPLYERNIIHDTNLSTDNLYPNSYFKITKDGVSFAPLVCYESTDVKVRAILKDEVNYIFTVAYNKDTQYFSSIGMSTSRDLFCFYIECNSSSYGSSSFAPYRNEFLPIASDKGNSRNHMHIISTDLFSLKEYKKEYNEAYDNYEPYDFIEPDKAELKIDKTKARFKKPSANTK